MVFLYLDRVPSLANEIHLPEAAGYVASVINIGAGISCQRLFESHAIGAFYRQ